MGAKCDMKGDRKVSLDAALELAERYGMKLIETSSKENKNVNEVFLALTEVVLGSKDLTKTSSGNLPLSNEKEKKKKKSDECCK